MLDLLETISGALVLAAYFFVAVAVPAGVVVLFVALIGTLIRTGLDMVIGLLPARVREIALLARIGRALRRVFIWSIGTLLFLALVGTSSTVPGPNIFVSGFTQMVITLSAIQDIVAQWFTGQQLGDMLNVLVPQTAETPLLTSLRDFQVLVAVHWHQTLDPGVNTLPFRWTFAAFTTSIAAIYLVFEPLRAVRKRVAVMIAPQVAQTTLTQESLERQAEMIAQALAKASPLAPAPVQAAPAASAWARPGMARAPAPMAPPAPGAVASQRVAVVTWDGELATELERQLDAAGFSPLVMRSVAEAFASRVWPAIVFIDARHLQWLSPDRLPLLVRARLVAITREGVRVPGGWQLDTHDVSAGADALLELLRRRDARRRAGSRDTGA